MSASSTWKVLGISLCLVVGTLQGLRRDWTSTMTTLGTEDEDDRKSQIAPMTRGGSFRRLSMVNASPVDDTDIGPVSSGESSENDSSSSSSSNSNSRTNGASVSTQSTPANASTSSKYSDSSSGMLGDNSTGSVSTKATTQGEADPGDHHSSFKHPLPPSYIYKDDDNAPSYEISSPLNPVVDDIAQFLDDDKYRTRNTTKVLPPEREPPGSWPLDVFVVFVGAAILLCAATCYKNYQKRKAYTSVPSS